jgi:hypothetical protein
MPYDRLVVAALCVLAEAGLDVSSDGDPKDWEEGRAWAQEVLGRPVKIPAGVECSYCGNTGRNNRKDLAGYAWYGELGDECKNGCGELLAAA